MGCGGRYLRVGELRSQLVPVRLHLLAVASPRRQELDEGTLAGVHDEVVEVAGGELHGSFRGSDLPTGLLHFPRKY